MAVPTVRIRSVISGTSIPANTGEVDIRWSVENNPEEVWSGGGAPSEEVLRAGSDDLYVGGGEGTQVYPPNSTGDLDHYDITRTHWMDIRATNADGTAEDRETFYAKIPVGYGNATVPGAPVKEADLLYVRTCLETIETTLLNNVLTRLPELWEDYNNSLPPELQLPLAFDDMDYLSGTVGTGSLADDILASMQNVLIYINPHTLPRGYRPGTITDPERQPLCAERRGTDGQPRCIQPGLATREWVAICVDCDQCLQCGADSLTLLRELFHHASNSNHESVVRAQFVVQCAFPSS